MNDTIASGEHVLLVDEKGRCYLKPVRSGHRLTVRGTTIKADDVIGRPEGTLVGSGQPESFWVFRPTHAELVPLLERPAEPIFSKDTATIIARGNIRAGSSVAEVGVGAGALTIAMLRAVGPNGRVTSYELREDFAEVAGRNVERFMGATPNWRIEVGDAAENLGDGLVDTVTVDVPEPARVLDRAATALRPGGALVVYVPTILQVRDAREAISTQPFRCVETLEVLERSWHVEGQSLRPDHRMVAHTGFLTFARKTVGVG